AQDGDVLGGDRLEVRPAATAAADHGDVELVVRVAGAEEPRGGECGDSRDGGLVERPACDGGAWHGEAPGGGREEGPTITAARVGVPARSRLVLFTVRLPPSGPSFRGTGL